MAISSKYGKINIPRISEDEPIFILRAQDKLAEAALQMYGALARSHGSRVSNGLEQEIEAFRKWTGKKKIPD